MNQRFGDRPVGPGFASKRGFPETPSFQQPLQPTVYPECPPIDPDKKFTTGNVIFIAIISMALGAGITYGIMKLRQQQET